MEKFDKFAWINPARGFARNGKVRLLFATSLALSTSVYGPGLAQDSNLRDNTVRQAAIKKMQSRLGEIRGSIALTDRHILLTQKMIDSLKPPQRSNTSGGPQIDPVVTNAIQSEIVIPEMGMDVIMRQADVLESRLFDK